MSTTASTIKFDRIPNGTRVQHLGSPKSFGTVIDFRPHLYATASIHADHIVKWETGSLAGYATRHGFNSLRPTDA